MRLRVPFLINILLLIVTAALYYLYTISVDMNYMVMSESGGAEVTLTMDGLYTKLESPSGDVKVHNYSMYTLILLLLLNIVFMSRAKK